MGWKTVALAVLTACGTGSAPPERAVPVAPADAASASAQIDAAAPLPVAAVADAAPAIDAAPEIDAEPPPPNPFAGKPCPPPKKVRARRGRGDRSKPLVADGVSEPGVILLMTVGDPALPVKPDPLEMLDPGEPPATARPEEEVFCGPVVEMLASTVRVAVDSADGPASRLFTIDLDEPLALPFAVGDPIVVHARESVGMFGPARLSVMITDADGDLLLAFVEGGEKRYAPGFYIEADRTPPSRGGSRRHKGARQSRPSKPRDRSIHVSRAGVRGETKESWRLLETRDGRWAIWGVNQWDGEVTIGSFRWRLRAVRLP